MKHMCVTAVLMLVVLSLWAVNAQVNKYAEVTGVQDFGTNTDDDTPYEYLTVSVHLRVNISGTYTATGVMVYAGRYLATASCSTFLPAGDRYLNLTYDGEIIHNHGAVGVYDIMLVVKYESTTLYNSTYSTNVYSPDDFDAEGYLPETPVRYRPHFENHGSYVAIRTGVFTLEYYKDTPKCVWYYTKTNGSYTKFYLTYGRIIGYADDDRNFYFTSDETKFEGSLEDPGVGWSEDVQEGTSKDFGEYVRYSIIYRNVPIREVSSQRQVNTATVNLTLTVGALDREAGYSSGTFVVPGGTAAKIDINITFASNLGVQGVVLEQMLYSRSKKRYEHDLRLSDASSTTITPQEKDSDEKKFERGPKEPQTVSFVAKYVSEYPLEAYYGWSYFTRVDAKTSTAVTTYQYIPDGKKLRLYTTHNVPGTSVKSVVHETTLGVFEGHDPPKDFTPPEEPVAPSALVFFLSVLAGVVLALLPIWLAGKKRR